MNANTEVVGLIATLHQAEQRLEELTSGEVDSVMDIHGHTLLMRSAQEQLSRSEDAKQAVILQLQAANEELETFNYSVSHDLRAPLRHILGFIELLQQQGGSALSEESLRCLAKISGSANRMAGLIDDLLAFSRTGTLELTKTNVDFNQLVADVLCDFQAETSARNIAWTIHPLPPVRADQVLLRMVLVNVISNAVKFTGKRAAPKIEIGCVLNVDDETVFFIRDNGAGFDPRYSDKLFGVFQRLHGSREFEGSGIGLANVRRIVKRHGGRTWAEGVVDGGAIFYFSIPRIADTIIAIEKS